ncbi:cornifelin homolog A-like [Aquarana catesbeiana]|uniref:cornifelin homolog A-like n=1 Tax=Aquarana catesbeiana TaxID=8400 RepID=UPI003CC9C388
MSYPVTMQPQAMPAYTTSQWSSDIMDCCADMGICLCGTFVPGILACKIASDYECCCLPILGGATLAMRTGIRERYHIPGSICNDWVRLVFCGPCALCQMARELKARK